MTRLVNHASEKSHTERHGGHRDGDEWIQIQTLCVLRALRVRIDVPCVEFNPPTRH